MLVESYDDLSDWNRGNKIETKREKISNILLDLSSEQDNEQKMNIPSIQCQSGGDLTTIKTTSEEKHHKMLHRLVWDPLDTQQQLFSILICFLS